MLWFFFFFQFYQSVSVHRRETGRGGERVKRHFPCGMVTWSTFSSISPSVLDLGHSCTYARCVSQDSNYIVSHVGSCCRNHHITSWPSDAALSTPFFNFLHACFFGLRCLAISRLNLKTLLRVLSLQEPSCPFSSELPAFFYCALWPLLL